MPAGEHPAVSNNSGKAARGRSPRNRGAAVAASTSPKGEKKQRTMIYDSLDHIETYIGLSEDLFLGLEFLKNVTPDIKNGVHELNPRVKAIVSEYETKKVNENGFEAHKKFIDIQYLLKGSERICCLPIEKMQETKPYQEEVEAAFYTANTNLIEMPLGNGYFAVFYPQDGHMPGLCVEKPVNVKKVVVKVRIGE